MIDMGGVKRKGQGRDSCRPVPLGNGSRLRRYILGVEKERVLPSKLVIAVLLYALVFTENQQNWVCEATHAMPTRYIYDAPEE